MSTTQQPARRALRWSRDKSSAWHASGSVSRGASFHPTAVRDRSHPASSRGPSSGWSGLRRRNSRIKTVRPRRGRVELQLRKWRPSMHAATPRAGVFEVDPDTQSADAFPALIQDRRMRECAAERSFSEHDLDQGRSKRAIPFPLDAT
jgi:hypothetical protein